MCSQTAYAGMTILSSLGKLRNEAGMTAEFLCYVNTSFDILSVHAFDSKAASPLARNSNAELDRLRRLKDEVAMWRVVGKSSRPPCFDGLVQDINVVLQMHESAVVDGPLDCLLTGRLNQDCSENFFSQVQPFSNGVQICLSFALLEHDSGQHTFCQLFLRQRCHVEQFVSSVACSMQEAGL